MSAAVEEGDGIPFVSGGLPTTIGANEDAIDDGMPAEVITPMTDELSSSGPGRVVSEKAVVISSAGPCWTDADEKAEKLVDEILIEEDKTVDCEERLLKPAEVCGIGPSDDTDSIEEETVVECNTICIVEVGEALAANRVIDVAIEKGAELTKEVVDISIVEEAMDCIVRSADEVIEVFGVVVAKDWRGELVDGETGNEEVACIVEPAIVDEATIIEDGVGTALAETADLKDMARTADKTVLVEDGDVKELEETLSALMMSAAFARVLNSCSKQFRFDLRTFSATPYTTACKCAAGITGNIPASTTLRFRVPAQIVELEWLR